jgi:hypothetical protein
MVDRVIHKQSVTCKFCSSPDIVKYGTFHGMQRYFCKSCRRKFADNDALPKMKTPIWIISLSLNCYYNGMSLAAVQREINQRHGAYYAQSSIYNWIMRFSGEAVRRASGAFSTSFRGLVVFLSHAGNFRYAPALFFRYF